MRASASAPNLPRGRTPCHASLLSEYLRARMHAPPGAGQHISTKPTRPCTRWTARTARGGSRCQPEPSTRARARAHRQGLHKDLHDFAQLHYVSSIPPVPVVSQSSHHISTPRCPPKPHAHTSTTAMRAMYAPPHIDATRTANQTNAITPHPREKHTCRARVPRWDVARGTRERASGAFFSNGTEQGGVRARARGGRTTRRAAFQHAGRSPLTQQQHTTTGARRAAPIHRCLTQHTTVPG